MAKKDRYERVLWEGRVGGLNQDAEPGTHTFCLEPLLGLGQPEAVRCRISSLEGKRRDCRTFFLMLTSPYPVREGKSVYLESGLHLLLCWEVLRATPAVCLLVIRDAF